MTISVSINKEADIGKFLDFMNSPKYPGKRAIILKAYPEIANAINDGADEKTTIENIVNNLYSEKEEQIKNILSDLKNELANIDTIINSLANIMNHDISANNYEAILTLLPFSPFKNNIFYFSIYSLIFKKKDGSPRKKTSIVFTAVHEISHFIFFDQLKKWEAQSKKKIPHPAEHYFKEALTAAIMNKEIFKNFFDYPKLVNSENYRGNPELHALSISKENNETENIVAFFEREMFQNKDNYKTNFFRLLDIFYQNQEKFAQKWELWNNWLLSPDEYRSAIMEEYSTPFPIIIAYEQVPKV